MSRGRVLELLVIALTVASAATFMLGVALGLATLPLPLPWRVALVAGWTWGLIEAADWMRGRG